MDYVFGDNSTMELALYDFEYSFKNATGIHDAEFEYIPETGVERETALDRIRTEIMSGGGPDVYIINCAGGEVSVPKGEALFRFPEKAMENGMFLPLDEYIENAQHAEWDKFTPALMNAGSNEEGQQLIPITYALPVAMYKKSDVQHEPGQITWEQMLTDEDLFLSAARLGDGLTMLESVDFNIDYILGELADYSKEELSFTEEELLKRVNKTLELKKYTTENKVYDAIGWSEGSPGVKFIHPISSNRFAELNKGLSYEDDLSFVPLYSDDGGCTAMVLTYAAINRNTQRPQDAFTILDFLLSTSMQQTSKFYSKGVYRSGYDTSLPIHEDLMSEEYPIERFWYLNDHNFQAVCDVRDQISNVQFAGQFNIMFKDLLIACDEADMRGEDYRDIVSSTYRTMEQMIHE